MSGSGAELGELLAQANGCLARQQLAEATPLLNLALKIAPEHPAVIAAVGGLYLLARQFEQARDWLQKAVTLQPDDAANRINLAQALTLLGSHEDAIAHLQAALLLDSQNAKLHFALGRALMEIGKIAEAIVHFEQAIALNPEYGLVYHLLSQIKKFSVDDIAFIEMADMALTHDLRSVDRCACTLRLEKCTTISAILHRFFRILK
ncbi:MAG: tetratricopeptide repeat protein [Pseudomonadales bacterium]